MKTLRPIYELLCQEYAQSRHIWWVDEAGKFVNDVTHTLRLIVQAAECVRRGEEDCWKELALYAVERSMSYLLMQAIGEYLKGCAAMPPLPPVDLTPQRYRSWQGQECQLLDETDRVALHAGAWRPEDDRQLNLKGDNRWSTYRPRLKDTHPAPQNQSVHKRRHWLF